MEGLAFSQQALSAELSRKFSRVRNPQDRSSFIKFMLVLNLIAAAVVATILALKS